MASPTCNVKLLWTASGWMTLPGSKKHQIKEAVQMWSKQRLKTVPSGHTNTALF